MRLNVKKFFLFLILATLIANFPLCCAQSIDPTGISLSAKGLPSMEYFQGDNGSIEVWIRNNGSEQVGIISVSAYFSWPGSNVFNLTLDATVNINVGDELYIGKINFTVPEDATVGYHNYCLYVDFESPPGGTKHNCQTSNYQIWVENQYKRICDEFAVTASFKLANARANVTDAQSAIQYFRNPQDEEAVSILSQAQGKFAEAQAYLNQAENAYGNASEYYALRAFQDAYTSFQECAYASDNASASAAEALSLIAQAQQRETVYQQQRQVQQVMIFAIPIILVIVAFVIMLLVKRRQGWIF
jgi:hypothetical protein